MPRYLNTTASAAGVLTSATTVLQDFLFHNRNYNFNNRSRFKLRLCRRKYFILTIDQVNVFRKINGVLRAVVNCSPMNCTFWEIFLEIS
ncbi:hypothetical protein CS542_06100 [Pedobacter sp. IW39]|nr:hypothetical protein CS542_06100 [Pedobacter sp. IW39]